MKENQILKTYSSLNDAGKQMMFQDVLFKFVSLLALFYESKGLDVKAAMDDDIANIEKFYTRTTREFVESTLDRVVDPTDDQFESDASIDLGLILTEFGVKGE